MNVFDELARFYAGRRVLVTGHTGFKGSWLSLWLHELGARVCGVALDPPGPASLFTDAALDEIVEDHRADILQAEAVREIFAEFDPECVFHLAAQSLVLPSYKNPLHTFEVNVMGTANVLEACRRAPALKSVLVVTSDKCYRNEELVWGHRENDPLGGHDPYSASKGCAELVTSSYTASFFPPEGYGLAHRVAVASARAGNVIGGGDWAENRLAPDCMRAFLSGGAAALRSPGAIRPWQHVLEPLYGYLLLCARLFSAGPDFSGPWNFAPLDRGDIWNVERVVKYLCELWGGASYIVDGGVNPHEAGLLFLDAAKARLRLGWSPRWDVAAALEKTVDWYKFWSGRPGSAALRGFMSRQIADYAA